MKIPNPYFVNVPNVGNLEFYYAFYILERPILFICKDVNKNLYLCSCCELYPKLQWVIAQVSITNIIALIDNELSLFDAFQQSQNKWVAEWEKGNSVEHIRETNLFDSDMLPDEGEYLDAEEEEFDDVVSLLLIENSDTHNIEYDQNGENGAVNDLQYSFLIDYTHDLNQKTISRADNFPLAA